MTISFCESIILFEEFPDGREGPEQTNQQECNRNRGDPGEIGFLVLPDIVQNRPGDKEDNDRPHGFAGQTADSLAPGHALCKSGLVIDFVDQGDQTHCGGTNTTGEQGSGHGSVDFLSKIFSQSCHDYFPLRDCKSLADCGGFGDKGTKHTGDCGGDEGEDEKDHHRTAFAHLLGKLWTVVTDYEGHDGGSDGGQKGDMLFPFHAELVPLGSAFTGEQQELWEGREIGRAIGRNGAIPRVYNPGTREYCCPN